MSRQLIILDASSDDDSEEDIPNPSPFSLSFRRPSAPGTEMVAPQPPAPLEEEEKGEKEATRKRSFAALNSSERESFEHDTQGDDSVTDPFEQDCSYSTEPDFGSSELSVEENGKSREEANSSSDEPEGPKAAAATAVEPVPPVAAPKKPEISEPCAESQRQCSRLDLSGDLKRPANEAASQASSTHHENQKQHDLSAQQPNKSSLPVVQHSDARIEAPLRSPLHPQPYQSSPSSDGFPRKQQKSLRRNGNGEVVSTHVQLDDIPTDVQQIGRLSQAELNELEVALQFDQDDPQDGWQKDWSANVSLLSRDVSDPQSRQRKSTKSETTRPLCMWALSSPQSLRITRNLMKYIYNEIGTPPTAKRIIAHSYHKSMKDPFYDLEEALKRLSYDPTVLREDGWVTAKSDAPIGATGGPYHVGRRVIWKRWEGVVIAYLHDDDIGDLWKAMWLDGFETFDLEAEELQDAMKRWERKFEQNEQPRAQMPARFATADKFTVTGIETGIVLAKTYNPNARHGLFWPARIMHVSEIERSSQVRRSSVKQKLNVMFLAPYWTGLNVGTANFALAESISQGALSSEPLFEQDLVEASDEMIQKYPYIRLNLDELGVAFRFTGLPKPAFPRFLDSHRLALALMTYAQDEHNSASTHSHAAAAALTDTHSLAIETAKFPPALLHLPFQYILSQLPRTTEKDSLTIDGNAENVEPTIQLRHIMLSMKPPGCWGRELEPQANSNVDDIPENGRQIPRAVSSALISLSSRPTFGLKAKTEGDIPVVEIHDIASDYLIAELSKLPASISMAAKLLDQLAHLLSRLQYEVTAAKSPDELREKLFVFLTTCIRIKGQGEDTICSEEFPPVVNAKTLVTDWRKACENIYKFCSSNFGNAVTFVISDPRCNEHLTSSGCVERPVRLPAALKGARLAGAEANVEMILSVEDSYMILAEQKIIGMAHTSSYLKRMRLKCAAIAPGIRGVPLTENSDSGGGEDTKGSRGSYTAAVAGVAAAIKGVDMIVGGQCLNAFCATRPPGHHAGRELHPLKAISNGFCILNNAACAALYAVTPFSERGPGLKRVCVIDIDVHHGNGTQDILCQTHDPRFLYVSLHVGGAHINGYEVNDADPEYRTSVGGSQRSEDGIFPGRCGDHSPHKGVLNIPLGARVTAQDVGTALVSLVGPAVLSFSPELIIISAGFDAHKNDPLGMGGLCAKDFAHITDVVCSMAAKSCSGRVLSVLEGGYGVPCCRSQKDLFLPKPFSNGDDSDAPAQHQQQVRVLELGEDLPDTMEDQVPEGMQKKLDKCHAEGFVDCVREHVESLAKCNDRAK